MSHDYQLDRRGLVDAIAGHIQTQVAIFGRQTSITEPVITQKAAEMLGQSRWRVQLEHPVDLEGRGAKHKHVDLVTYKVAGADGSPASDRITSAYELKVLKPNQGPNPTTFQGLLLLDVLRLAALQVDGNYKLGEGYQFVVASLQPLRRYATAGGAFYDEEIFGSIWAAMSSTGNAQDWNQVTKGLKGRLIGDLEPELEKRLDYCGAKFTKPRRSGGASLYDIRQACSDSLKFSDTNRVSVYRLLDRLEDAGVKKIIVDDTYSRHVRVLDGKDRKNPQRDSIGQHDWLVWTSRAKIE